MKSKIILSLFMLFNLITLNTFASNLPYTSPDGHTGAINSVSFSPDSKTLVSGSEDTSIRLRDVNTGNLLHTLEGHSSSVNSVSFSPDGKTLASGSGDRTIRLWDVNTGQSSSYP